MTLFNPAAPINLAPFIASLLTACVVQDPNTSDSGTGESTAEAADIPADLPSDESEIRCLVDEWGPSCAVRADGDTWITHLTRECDPLVPDLSRSPMPGMPGWFVQDPVAAIEFESSGEWPFPAFSCMFGNPIELGQLDDPQCGKACLNCVVRCAAFLGEVFVMIAPECLLGAYTLTPNEIPPC